MISSVVFKIFENCLLSYLQYWCPTSRLQFGYKKGTSTLLATCIFKENVKNYIHKNSSVYSCFLDLSKAFERVEHDRLILKLEHAGAPSSLIRVLGFMLKNTYIRVSYGDQLSYSWKSQRGVRQGGVLSAHLFSFYIDEILKEISYMPYACNMGINKINIQAYADDIVLFCSSQKGLQCMLDKINVMLLAHGLEVNIGKTKVLIFRKATVCNHRVNIFNLGGSILETVKSYRYLGCIISDNLCEKEDIERLSKSFIQRVGMFYRKFNTVELNVKFRLLNVLCFSFYGSELWHDKSRALGVFRKFAVAYHISLKKLLGLPKYFSNHIACNVLDVLTFEHLMNLNIFNFCRFLSKCDSPCFSAHKSYFMYFSCMRRAVDEISSFKYNIGNVLDNDWDAVKSRIRFVQSNEDSSNFVGF